MRPLILCGKPNYILPEILRSEELFDGFAIDLWASGVILLITRMLVGLPPWEFVREEDPRYRRVTKGGLSRMLQSWNRPAGDNFAPFHFVRPQQQQVFFFVDDGEPLFHKGDCQ